MSINVSSLGIDGLQDIVQIGTGGTSRVYRASQVDLDREVAVKVINASEDPDVARRFDRERKAMGRMSQHEGIVPVYSTGVTVNREPYLVMPYYPDGSLQDKIDVGPMNWREAAEYVDTSAETIAAAHEAGIVHLDIKPANILLTPNGAPRIADFGIAKIASNNTSTSRTTGTAFTPAYSAPETFLDGVTSPASDVYGLGATLWALIGGHPPFLAPGDENNLMAVIGRVVNNPVGDLRRLCPSPLCDVIERAMSKRPEDRYQTARQFSLALKDAVAAASPNGALDPDIDRRPSLLFPDLSGPGDEVGAANWSAGHEATITVTSPVQPAPNLHDTNPDLYLVDGPAIASARIVEPNATTAFDAAPTVNHEPYTPYLDQATESAQNRRPLLQESAQQLPRPPVVYEARESYVDFDRFRAGPLLVAFAMALVVGLLSLWVLNRGDDTQTDAVSTDDVSASSTTDPANPSVTVTTRAGGATLAPPDDAEEDATDTVVTTEATSATTRARQTTTTEAEAPDSPEPTEAPTTETSTTETSTTETSTTEPTTTETTTVPEVGAPTDLTATLDNDSVRLTWKAPSDGGEPTGYRIVRDGAFLLKVEGTSYVDEPALEPGDSHTYQVVAVIDDIESEPSNSATISVPARLSVTRSVVATSTTSVTIKIESDTCIRYRLSWINSETGERNVTNSTGPCAELFERTIDDLEPGTAYVITIVATSGNEEVAAEPLQVRTQDKDSG